MITTVFSKPLHYGGRNFLIYNDKTKRYHIGNTASTAVSYSNYDIYIEDVTTKQLKNIARQLEQRHEYQEYRVNWDKKVDTYGDISKQLLVRSK